MVGLASEGEVGGADNNQCCGAGAGSGRIRNYLPDPELLISDPDPASTNRPHISKEFLKNFKFFLVDCKFQAKKFDDSPHRMKSVPKYLSDQLVTVNFSVLQQGQKVKGRPLKSLFKSKCGCIVIKKCCFYLLTDKFGRIRNWIRIRSRIRIRNYLKSRSRIRSRKK